MNQPKLTISPTGQNPSQYQSEGRSQGSVGPTASTGAVSSSYRGGYYGYDERPSSSRGANPTSNPTQSSSNPSSSQNPSSTTSQARTLNITDALDYLQHVKVQFQDRPEIYNRFLEAMKSFRSQSIEQLDVIKRVSDLFRGYPSLIVGFNTFLPPGYRIEYGPNEHDPVRVITPHSGEHTTPPPGTDGRDSRDIHTHSSLSHSHSAAGKPHTQAHSHEQGYGHEGYYPKSQGYSYATAGPEQTNPSQQQGASIPPTPQHAHSHSDMQRSMHHQQQQYRPQSGYGGQIPGQAPIQAVTTAGSAVEALNSAAAAVGKVGMTVDRSGTPGNGQGRASPASSLSLSMPNMRRGVGNISSGPGGVGAPGPPVIPIEFDQAVTYVNKIKRRYSNSPDKYRQFLEILENFKNENVGIAVVLQQIQELFRESPELVEGFQKYMPAAGVVLRNGGGERFMQVARGVNGVSPGMQGDRRTLQQPRHPRTVGTTQGTRRYSERESSAPMGSSASPPPSARLARRRRDDIRIKDEDAMMGIRKAESPGPRTVLQAAAMKARQHMLLRSPAGHPALLHPYPPHPLSAQLGSDYSEEEIAFFDTARKVINNKAAYQEFLKVLNLFTQDILDKRSLIERVESFLGSRAPQLVDWFKKFVTADDRYDEIESEENGIASGYGYGYGYAYGYNNAGGTADILGRREDEENAAEDMGNPSEQMKARTDTNNWKMHGPSYRRMPSDYPQPVCSGRDELCREVLNDDWVSDPTWASEDNGFIVHRKSQYEEALHKVEEERYEFDMNIDANLQTIKLLEPVAEHLSTLSPEERSSYQLPANFGGVSKSIYKRILKKIYDAEHGEEVIEALQKNPGVTVPLILKRLKQKHDEWREQQKEWNRYWRDMEVRNYYKALDLQGYTIKTQDKKLFSSRSLLAEIEVIKREQAEKWFTQGKVPERHQLDFCFPTTSVFRDMVALCFSFLDRQNHLFQDDDRGRVKKFFRQFVLVLFSIDEDKAMEGARSTVGKSRREGRGANSSRRRRRENRNPAGRLAAVEEDDSSAMLSDADGGKTGSQTGASNKRSRNGRSASSRRRQLPMEESPPKKPTRTHSPAGSGIGVGNGAVSDSTMPDSEREDERMSVDDDASSVDQNHRYGDENADPNLSRKSDTRYICMFGNSKFCVVIRLFIILYNRLAQLKAKEKELAALAIERSRINPVAIDLALRSDRSAQGSHLGNGSNGTSVGPNGSAYNGNTSSSNAGPLNNGKRGSSESSQPAVDKMVPVRNPYSRALALVDRLLDAENLDQNSFEERLRSLYGPQAYTLFTIDRLILSILRQIILVTNDLKSLELLKLFEQDRALKGGRTERRENVYRLSVENIVGGEEDVYRIEFDTRLRRITIELLSKEDWVDNPNVTKEEHWSSYVDRYMMLNTPEGVEKLPFLARNIQPVDPKDVVIEGGLELKICVNTYKLFFCAGSEDVLYRIRRKRKHEINGNEGKRILYPRKKEGKFERWVKENGPTPVNASESSDRTENTTTKPASSSMGTGATGRGPGVVTTPAATPAISATSEPKDVPKESTAVSEAKETSCRAPTEPSEGGEVEKVTPKESVSESFPKET